MQGWNELDYGKEKGLKMTPTKFDRKDEGAVNTDKEIWRKVKGDYYSPSIHITKGNGVGINVGGKVFVMPVEKWHELADGSLSERPMMTESEVKLEVDKWVCSLLDNKTEYVIDIDFKDTQTLARALSGNIPTPELDRVEVSEAELKEIIKRLNNSSDDNFNISMYEIDRIAHALSGHIPAPEKVCDRNCCTTTGEHWWLKEEPNVCSICGFNKKDKVITYEDWKGVIRDTPLTIKGLKQVGRTLFFVDLDDESIGVLATSIIYYLNKRERSNE